MPLPQMYHFTRATPGCAAVQDGLLPLRTQNDPLQIPGVWLSPNVYGHGSPGNYFGAVGLAIEPAHLSAFQATYIGEHPRHRNRYRFILHRPGDPLPDGLTALPIPPDAKREGARTEYHFPEHIPANMICGIRFGHHAGYDDEHDNYEHQRVLSFLLATRHRLICRVPHPHSTEGAVGGGWWIFHQLRRRIVRLASVEGAEVSEQQALDLLRDFAVHGEMVIRKNLPAMAGESVHRMITATYAAAFREASGTEIDLADDIPFAG